MQWRMVGRRGRTATWTIVGDPAQSSWPVPAESAAARAAALEGKELHEFHLSTNYRNSSEIYEYAAAYAERVGLDADLPDRGPLDRRRAARGRRRRRPRGGDPRAGRRDRRPGRRHGRRSSSRSPAAPRSTRWLASWPEFADDAPARAPPSTPGGAAGEDRIVVLTGLDTKGLEFDGIVVVDPDEIEAESADRPGHALRRAHPRHPAADAHPLRHGRVACNAVLQHVCGAAAPQR